MDNLNAVIDNLLKTRLMAAGCPRTSMAKEILQAVIDDLKAEKKRIIISWHSRQTPEQKRYSFEQQGKRTYLTDKINELQAVMGRIS